jgi:hypothetical protein
VNRATPSTGSDPTVAIMSPITPLMRPLTSEPSERDAISDSAKNARAKYSKDPKLSANFARSGDRKLNRIALTIVPTKDAVIPNPNA